jgi:transcriptional regulator with XRE-family HTH domain
MAMAAREIKWDTLGGRMYEARIRARLTRRQASSAAQYSSISTLDRYEGNRVTAPRDDIVFKFAELYGVDPIWLLHGRGEPGWAVG